MFLFFCFFCFLFFFFKLGTAFTCNSIETTLGVKRYEKGVGAEDAIFFEFNIIFVQRSPYCEADICDYLKIQTAKESAQFKNSFFATAGN